MAYNDFSGQERRRFVRLYYPLKVKFRIISGENNEESLKIYSAISKNISVNALCMEIDALYQDACDRIKSGQDKLELEITLDSDKNNTIKLSGSAIRFTEEYSKSYNTGVIFTRLEEDDKLKLLHFLKTNISNNE